MLRPNANCGEVRKGNFVPVPHCAKSPESARRSAQRGFAAEQLKLRISRWQVAPISRGINFLGYRIWPSHKLLRKDSVTRAKRKVANFIKPGEDEGLQTFLASWSGHAMWADANHLFTWLENRHGIALH